MLSASLPERLREYRLPARFGLCRLPLWWGRLCWKVCAPWKTTSMRAPRDRAPSLAHAVRFASRNRLRGHPLPVRFWFMSGVLLVETASLTGLRLW